MKSPASRSRTWLACGAFLVFAMLIVVSLRHGHLLLVGASCAPSSLRTTTEMFHTLSDSLTTQPKLENPVTNLMSQKAAVVPEEGLGLPSYSFASSPAAQQLMSEAEFNELSRLVSLTRQPPERTRTGLQHFNATGGPTCAPKRRLLFSLSTGHTGTMWLLRVLRCSKCAGRIEHEPKPSLVSFPYILRKGRLETYEDRKAEKLPVLLQMLHNGTHSPGMMYAETSHMFIKSWWDVLTDWLRQEDPTGEKYDVDIIVLRRNISSVVRSFLTDRMFWNPAFNVLQSTGGEYTLSHRRMALLPALYPHGAEDSIDEVLGYLADMELQYARFRAAFPQFRYWDVRSEELYDPQGLRRILNDLGMGPYDQRCLNMLSFTKPVNQHVSWKAPTLLEVSPDYFLARAHLFAHKYRVLGIPFPEMPQMKQTYRCNTTEVAVPWCEGPYARLTLKDILTVLRSNTNITMNHPAVLPPVPLYATSERYLSPL